VAGPGSDLFEEPVWGCEPVALDFVAVADERMLLVRLSGPAGGDAVRPGEQAPLCARGARTGLMVGSFCAMCLQTVFAGLGLLVTAIALYLAWRGLTSTRDKSIGEWPAESTAQGRGWPSVSPGCKAT